MTHHDPTPQFSEAIRSGRFRGLLVPTSVLLSIAMAAGAGVWAGAKFFYGNLESRVAVVEIHQGETDRKVSDQAQDIAVMKANAINLAANMAEMNRKLDTIIDLMLHRNDRTP